MASDTLVATREQMGHLAGQAMSTSEGRMHIAAQMMPAMKAEIDYTAVGRQPFIRDLLEQGDIPYYDKDVKVPAVMLSKRGIPPEVRQEGNRVWANIRPFASYPLVPIEDTRLRRYDILSRVQEKARADLAIEEDRSLFGIIDSDGNAITSVFEAAATVTASSALFTGGNPVQVSTEGLTRDLLAATLGTIMARNLMPTRIFLSPRDYADLLIWGRDELDPETQREVRETGRMGRIWNMDIVTSYVMPPGVAYMTTEGEYFGTFPILIDLEVMDAPDPSALSYGFLFLEYVGAIITNSGGICKMIISRS